MLDTINPAEGTACAADTATASTSAANTTTKAELLKRAKAAIEAGEQSLHDAAEALGLAKEDHSATQREMAEAVGKSASWVNKLLRWRRSGFTDDSPFGPTTKRGRVEHAQQRAKASKPGKAREPKATASAEADDADASAERRKAEYAKKEAKTPASTKKEAKTPASTVTNALDGFKSAVDYWFPKMDDDAKREAVTYAITKGEVKVA
jgi:hypothetical protein